MTIKPIPMREWEVRALLREIEAPGTGKTQTRGVANPIFAEGANREFTGWRPERRGEVDWQLLGGMGIGATLKVPYAPGDLLWAQEPWRIAYPKTSYSEGCVYRADRSRALGMDEYSDRHEWLSPARMPRRLSRLTLRVTDVRCERLQDISAIDVEAEGLAQISKDNCKTWKWGIPDRDGLPGKDDHGWNWQDWSVDHRAAYSRLWSSLHGSDAWDKNPWVWAISFRPIASNVDQIKEAK